MTKLLLSGFICCLCFMASGQQAYITTEKAHADLTELIETIEATHYNPYFATSKAAFNQQKTELTASWYQDSISLKKFVITGMKLAALLSGGHSGMSWKAPGIIPEVKAHVYIPFTGKLSSDTREFVITRSEDEALKPGMVITTINGLNMTELFAETMTYVGGIEAFKNASCEKLLPIYLFFNDQLKPPYSINLKNNNVPIKSEGLTIKEIADFINREQPKKHYTFSILQGNIGLISYNSCTNYKRFKRFLKSTFAEIKAKKITQLIIDIRENGGGNSDLNDLLLAYITTKPYRQSSDRYWKVSNLSKKAYADPLYSKVFGQEFIDQYMNTATDETIETIDGALTHPKKPRHYFEGKTCFLIGPNTFSSANFLADAIKTYELSTLIGEPTGENTNDFGEIIGFKLKHSQCQASVSSTYDIGANGNDTLMAPVYPDFAVNDSALDFAIQWMEKEF